MERLVLAVMVALYTCSFDRVEGELRPEAEAVAEQGLSPGLRELAAPSGLRVGAAVASGPLRSDEAYRKLLAREYDLLTPENALKFAQVHPEPDRYDFADFDEMISFAESHRMQVRGHTLVWHHQLPSWVEERPWTRDELREVLGQHIREVVGRYRGRVRYWDVVNEAVSDHWGLRNTIWLKVLGPEYIEMAFRFAHQADPDALLFYNDYGVERPGRKSARMLALVSELLEREVPIHGVGLQAHLAEGIPAPGELEATLLRIEKLGLEVHLTEVDVGIPQPTTEARLRKQAILYQRLMDACLSVRSCGAFVTWGFTDAHSWIPRFFPGLDAALPFDDALRPKLAYGALAGSLSASPRTGASGSASRSDPTSGRAPPRPGPMAAGALGGQAREAQHHQQ